MAAGGSALGQVLEDIHAARISTAERRRLAALAVRLALFPEPPLGHRDSEVLGRLQAVLVQVGREFGLVQPSVQAAKAELRSYGEPGRRLAGRLGRLSQVRNAAAHPDLELEKDIEELAKAGKGKSLVKGVVDLEACDEYYGIQCEDAGTQTHVDGKDEKDEKDEGDEKDETDKVHDLCTDPGSAVTDTSTDISTDKGQPEEQPEEQPEGDPARPTDVEASDTIDNFSTKIQEIKDVEVSDIIANFKADMPEIIAAAAAAAEAAAAKALGLSDAQPPVQVLKPGTDTIADNVQEKIQDGNKECMDKDCMPQDFILITSKSNKKRSKHKVRFT